MEDTRDSIEELNEEEAKQYIGGIVFVTFLMVIGIIGNLHVLIIYTFRMKPSNHRIFILVLGVLDFITCIVGMPFIIVDLRNPLTFTSEPPCKVLRFVNYFICASSALILLVIATDRYRKICVPLGKQISQRVAKCLCLLMLGISLAISWPAPVLYGRSTVKTRNPNITGIRCFTVDKYKETKYQAYFNAVLILIVVFVFVALVVLYSLIGKVISKHSAFKKKTSSPSKHSSEGPTKSTDESELKDSGSSGSYLVNNDKLTTHPEKTKTETQEANNDLKRENANSQSEKATVGRYMKVDFEQTAKSKMSSELPLSSEVSKGEQAQQSMSKPTTLNQQTKKFDRAKRTTFMFLLITAVFFLSYVPHLVLKIITFLNTDFVPNMSFTGKVFYNTFVWCFFINNMANSFIYGFCDIRFRTELRAVYNKLLCRN